MLACHTALYREAAFTVRVAGSVSVVATLGLCQSQKADRHGYGIVSPNDQQGFQSFQHVCSYNVHIGSAPCPLVPFCTTNTWAWRTC